MTLKEIMSKIIMDHDGALFLNKKEAAKVLGISVATLDNYRSIGQLQSIKRGQRITFSVEAIAKAMRDGIDATGMREHIIHNFNSVDK